MPLADETRIEELLDRVLTPVPKDDPQGTERERCVVPVAQFFALFDKRQPTLCNALAPLLRTRILRSLDRGDIEALGRLAAIAALADVEDVTGVLFSATLDEIGNGGRSDPNLREILFGAIARFARPGGIKQWKSAAGFAQGVLSRTDSVIDSLSSGQPPCGPRWLMGPAWYGFLRSGCLTGRARAPSADWIPCKSGPLCAISLSRYIRENIVLCCRSGPHS